MSLFIAGAAALLMVAAVLAHKLKYPADTLGLRAARAEVIAMSKKEPWFNPRPNEDDDDAMLDHHFGNNRFGGGSGGGNGRNDHGRKPKDSCMVMLVLMLGGGAAAVLGGIAAVRGLA